MSKKVKAANWVHEEIDVLLEEVHSNKETLFSKLGGFITQETKNSIWESITRKVNSVSKSQRTAETCKKKWIDMKYATRQNELHRAQQLKLTGGGPCSSQQRSPYDTKIIAIIGPVSVEGIPSGVDSLSATIKPAEELTTTDFQIPAGKPEGWYPLFSLSLSLSLSHYENTPT